MRLLKGVLSIVIIVAIAAGIFLYINSQGTENGMGTDSASQASGGAPAINEFLASNSAVLPDESGDYSDWIEVYNPTANSMNLSGYGLSDDSKSASWTFPGITLQPGGYIVVFASGKDISDKNAAYQHTNFKLNSSGGGLYLFSADGKVADKVEYDAQTENVSLGRDPQNGSQFIPFDKPTPGFSNDEAGFAAFQQSRIKQGSTLFMTEINPSNKTAYVDNKGNASDYIEIYNGGQEAVNLNGYGLSDDPAKVLKWKFPDIAIGPGEYLVVFASGDDKNSTDAAAKAIHTNFRISAYRETIVLSDPAGYILDQISLPETPPKTDYARKLGSDGAYLAEWELTTAPTPGAPSGAA